ncbi:MAG TPA: N-acetyltransferase [Chthonomonadaceae bacterium]|nr:N-acetyltransferase [Chthonomonadaceae bacterium]
MDARICEASDFGSVRHVLEQAFHRPSEADLVDALRQNGHLTLALSAEVGGRVVGFVGFSPVEVRSEGRRIPAQGLAPLAVHPDFQRTGIGSALVRAGLEATFKHGNDIVVVLGSPEFYGRFGFENAARRGILWEHGGSEAFQVIGRAADAFDGVTGFVSYGPEFAGV